MITDKTIELADKAKNCLEENKIYTSKQVCYGYSEKLIELVVEECIEAIKRTDLRQVTYTNFDKDRLEYTINTVIKSVQSNFGTK
jgi:hydroxylamine reductase (hybrid-cluster protein)